MQTDYVERLNAAFARIGTWSFDHRRIVLPACVLVLAICAGAAARTRFDNSLQAYFDKGDPVYASYLRYRDDFGSDEVSYLLYEAPGYPHGPWNLEVMRKISSLTAALDEEVPFVKEVTSLTNVEYVEPIPDGIKIYDLLEDFPSTQDELLAIREKVLAKPLYIGRLVSRDGAHAAIVLEMQKSTTDSLEQIRLDPDGGDGLDNLYPQASYNVIEEILGRPEYEGITFHHVGDVPLNAIYNKVIQRESGVLAAMTFAVIALLLFAFLWSAIGVIGPLVVVGLSIMVCLAFVGLMSWKLDLMFTMLPNLLIAVGVANAVHIITEFKTCHVKLGDRREATRHTLYLLGAPCLLTSLTTAAGFTSMSVAPIKAISHFAIYSAVGVLAGFLLSVTLLLAFLSFGPRVRRRTATERELLRAKGGAFFQMALGWVARFDVRHRRSIIACSAGVFLVSILGAMQLRVDSNFLHEFSKNEPIRVATKYVDDTMGGTISFVYLFDSGAEGGIKEPEALREIERLQAKADEIGNVVKDTSSVVDLLKDINQAFQEGNPAYYVVPDSRELAAQYILVYQMSGGDELHDYVSTDLSRANLEVRVKTVESSRHSEVVDGLGRYLHDEPVRASTVSITGVGALWLQLMNYITQSQIRGFLLAFAVIATLLCFIFKSVKTGLIAMVPNLSPVLLTLGVMGWFGLSLDYIRLLIASVAIGISVDDTIHLVTRLVHEFRRCGNYERALHEAMADVGRALFITSAVLTLGFLVLLFSTMDSLVRFGALLAGTVVMALIADFFLMPALVLTLKPFGPESVHSEQERPGIAAAAAG
jgi:predicted RND superfamily exporter protein